MVTSADGDAIFKGLVGAKGFKRQNPMTDKFRVLDFHHVEFWCGDATMAYKRYVFMILKR